MLIALFVAMSDAHSFFEKNLTFFEKKTIF